MRRLVIETAVSYPRSTLACPSPPFLIVFAAYITVKRDGRIVRYISNNSNQPFSGLLAQGKVAPLLWIGGIATLLYAAIRLAAPEFGEKAGTVMALLGLVGVLTWGRGLRSSAPLWLLLGIILVELLAWGLGYLHHPQWIPENPELDRMAKWFLFIGMAWWLRGSSQLTWWAWGLGVLGLLVAVWLEGGGWQTWQRGLAGHRVDFGIHNAQHVAMFFGTAVLGLAVFAPRALSGGQGARWRRVAWGVAMIACVTGVVITQTRGVWLALIVSALGAIGAVAWYHWRMKHADVGHRRLLAWVAGSVMLAVVALAVFHEPILKRVSTESTTVSSILEGDWESVPYRSSIGNRVHSWRAAVEWIAERPVIGWGGEGRSLVMDYTEWMPEWNREHYGHLHNTYLEVIVSYGLLGGALIAVLAYWVGRGTWLAWRSGYMPGDLALFGYGFFVYFLIANMFESYLSFWSGGYVFTMVMGGLVTHIWRWQVRTKTRILPIGRRQLENV